MKAFPVPAVDLVHVPIPETGKYHYVMYDLTGRIVNYNTLQHFNSGDQLPIFRGNLPAGYYLLVFESEGRRYISRIIWE